MSADLICLKRREKKEGGRKEKERKKGRKKKINVCTGDMAQWLKHFPHKHED